VAEILSSNDGMIRLARAGSGAGETAAAPKVTLEDNGGTVRVTTLW